MWLAFVTEIICFINLMAIIDMWRNFDNDYAGGGVFCGREFCSRGEVLEAVLQDTTSLAVSSAYKSRVLRSGRTNSRSPLRISRQFSSPPTREGPICDNRSIPNLMMLRPEWEDRSSASLLLLNCTPWKYDWSSSAHYSSLLILRADLFLKIPQVDVSDT